MQPRRLVALTLVLLAACGSDDSTTSATTASAAGSYTLQTANGAALPATLTAFGGVGGSDVITSGTFALDAGGTWRFNLVGSSSGRTTNVTRDCCYTGTWTQSGSSISLSATPSNSWTGTSAVVDGATLTYVERGVVFVFRK